MPSQEYFNEMIQFFFTLQLLNKLYHLHDIKQLMILMVNY